MPVGRAGKVSTHPFAMVVWIAVEKSGGIVEERKKNSTVTSTTQCGDAKKHGS